MQKKTLNKCWLHVEMDGLLRGTFRQWTCNEWINLAADWSNQRQYWQIGNDCFVRSLRLSTDVWFPALYQEFILRDFLGCATSLAWSENCTIAFSNWFEGDESGLVIFTGYVPGCCAVQDLTREGAISQYCLWLHRVIPYNDKAIPTIVKFIGFFLFITNSRGD